MLVVMASGGAGQCRRVPRGDVTARRCQGRQRLRQRWLGPKGQHLQLFASDPARVYQRMRLIERSISPVFPSLSQII